MRAAVNFRHCLILLGAIFLVSTPAQADPQPQVALEQVGVTEEGDPIYKATWSGVALRTYFAEFSLDLVNWDFLPVVQFGTGAQQCNIVLEGTSKIYMRLYYADSTGATTLQEARDMDFDGDKIPNYFEVEDVGSDPLDDESMGGDSDSDGLPDGWELYHFGNLDQDGSDDADNDGSTNAEELAAGTNPVDRDTDGDTIPDGEDIDPLTPEENEFVATELMVISPLK